VRRKAAKKVLHIRIGSEAAGCDPMCAVRRMDGWMDGWMDGSIAPGCEEEAGREGEGQHWKGTTGEGMNTFCYVIK
jgi:hypothetical protein